MKLSRENLTKTTEWEGLEVTLPFFDVESVGEKTKKEPTWVHFGGGDFFRGYVASLAQRLLNEKWGETGVILVEPYDQELIPKIYDPVDQLSLHIVENVTMESTKEVIGSVTESVQGYNLGRIGEIFKSSSLQMVTVTLKQEDYLLKDATKNYRPEVLEGFKTGYKDPKDGISLLTAALVARFEGGKLPIAVVSLDAFNSFDVSEQCGHTLRSAVLTYGKEWQKNGLVPEGFYDYVKNQRLVTFPWTSVDKRVFSATEKRQKELEMWGLEAMGPVTTSKGTTMYPFVVTERFHSLVVEDRFPNGRPALEKTGVVFGKREVVTRTNQLKKCRYENPLVLALGIYCYLLGHETLAQGMNDIRVVKLLRRLAYEECLSLKKQGDILGKVYLDEMLQRRLPNDAWNVTAAEVLENFSQKFRPCFGDILKAYEAEEKKGSQLVAIPLVYAGWFRYLFGLDDQGRDFVCVDDPVAKEFSDALEGVRWGDSSSYQGELRPFFRNRRYFGLNLIQFDLGRSIETMLKEQLFGKGGVAGTLQHYLK